MRKILHRERNMALLNLKDVLSHAYENKYGVGSFNVINMEFLEAIIEAAEKKQSPVILSIAEVHFKYINIENITPAIREVARRSDVPVVVHLDHGTSFPAIVRALRAGFTSVMYDGSVLPYEENVRNTQEVVRMCHAVGVTVEAELGHVAGAEGGGDDGSGGHQSPEEFYTNVDEAIDFVRRTGVDCLAVAVGTAHGLYKGTPKLDYERLSQLNNALKIPLVLHGGTGLAAEDFRRAISMGVAKINFYTGMSVAACDAIREVLQQKPDIISFPDMMQDVKASIQKTVEENMEIFMSTGVCTTTNELCPYCTGCETNPPVHITMGQPRPQPDRELIDRVTKATVEALRKMGY
jgi:fructose-bisphosphate aldolase class II